MSSGARGAIEARRARGGRAFVPFLTAGYPDWESCDATILALGRAGADVLELGAPFSDPIADGPTIQAASQRAIANGVTLTQILAQVRQRHDAWGLPVVLMSYLNPILAYGAQRFSEDAAAAGVAGVLLSDLPPEELPELWRSLDAHRLQTVVLVAPTSRPERLAKLAAAATGFVYCVTRTGVTGAGGAFAENLAAQIALVRQVTDVPIVAGFGIRSAEDVRRLAPQCDGVVVGARLLELAKDGTDAVESFARELRSALDEGAPTS